ncbi:MAG: PQQ-like beta-propeller repeat protein [Ignavibacteriales bacterium]|nr:PQQ-like beta-propeller repeat protein [Ignavibacteriales bacterium]
MKNIFYLILISSILILSGCAKSLIKLVLNDEANSHLMFGKNNARNFFNPVEVSDSLNLIWESEAYGSFTNNSVIYKDSVIIVGDLGGRIHCFDLISGKQVGVLKSKGSVYSTPIIIKYKLVYALVDQNENLTELIYYDMFNGKELETVEIEGRVLTQMLLDDDDIILCTEDGNVKKYSNSGNLIWEFNTKSKIYSNPASIDSIILIANDNGEIISLNSETGKQNYKVKIGDPFFSGISIDKSIAFIADNSGIIYSFDVKNGKLNWSFKSSARINMNPAIDDKYLYIGNLNGDLYSIDKNSGQLNWKSELDGVLNSTPFITNNRVIVSNLFKSFSIVNKVNGSVTKNTLLNQDADFLQLLLITN